MTESNNLEHRQFIGLVIDGNKFSVAEGLVLVKGIYYHYRLEDAEVDAIEPQLEYRIVDEVNNLLMFEVVE